jgi:hypothetical protein
MNKLIKFKNQSGQSLVLLLIFVLMAMAFTTTAMLMSVIGSGSIVSFESGVEVRQLADSGVENALLRIIRDPVDYAGETYSLGEGIITIDVTGATSKTVTVAATLGEFTRTIEVLAQYNNNVLSVTSWKEVY